MAFQVLNPGGGAGRDGELGYTRQRHPFVVELVPDRPNRGARVELFPQAPFRWSWPAMLVGAQLELWRALLETLGTTRDAFLLKDYVDPERVGIAVEPAVGDGARVTFSLPTATSSPDWPLYPLAASVQVKVGAGAYAAPLSVNQDGRTFTLAAAPGVGVAVLVRYTPLRLVVLEGGPEEARLLPSFAHVGLQLREVFRD